MDAKNSEADPLSIYVTVQKRHAAVCEEAEHEITMNPHTHMLITLNTLFLS
jgi:hypothetical protein